MKGMMMVTITKMTILLNYRVQVDAEQEKNHRIENYDVKMKMLGHAFVYIEDKSLDKKHL